MRPQHDSVQFGNSVIAYSIQRSVARCTIAVTVLPNSLVRVNAPAGIRRKDISTAVRRKAAWILRQQEVFHQQMRSRPKQFVSGESVLYYGRQYKLKIKRCSNPTPIVRVSRGEIIVAVQRETESGAAADVIRRSLIRWYRQKANDRLLEIAERFGTKLGLSFRSLSVRQMPKRWGSGGEHGRLSFNWKIIMAPRRLVEYVVAHELCHLKYGGHSHLFWRLLERAMPDYERRRQELAVRGPIFDL